jgi:hypothetical protein
MVRRLLNVEFLLGRLCAFSRGDGGELSITNGDDLTAIPCLLLSFEARRLTV